MTWRMSPATGRGMGDADLPSRGIPLESEYVAQYMQRTGRKNSVSPAEWNYYMVFNMFRLAAILQGIAHRAQQGNASSEHAVDSGKRARPLAEQAWALAQEIDASR
jgi:aminoglycoside phosphotransferase (APT) family kinase protein